LEPDGRVYHIANRDESSAAGWRLNLGVTEHSHRCGSAAAFEKTIGLFMEQRDVPVTIGEFGGHRWKQGLEGFLQDQIQLFESRGINWAYWPL
jgi:hypothetical protein